MSSSSRVPDRVGVIFDEPSLVADAGLIVPTTPGVRLGPERLVDQTLRFSGRVGGANSGAKILTLVFGILAGASHVDHYPGSCLPAKIEAETVGGLAI